MVFGVNKKVYPGHGRKHDIRLSFRDYKDMAYWLKDDNLTNEGLLRMKNIYAINGYFGLATLVAAIIPSYAASKFLVTGVNRGPANYRVMAPAFMAFYLCGCSLIYGMKMPRRIYTDIFTDNTTDGQYIRRELRFRTPKLWANISKQLWDNGYRFDEMYEVSMEVPNALLE